MKQQVSFIIYIDPVGIFIVMKFCDFCIAELASSR